MDKKEKDVLFNDDDDVEVESFETIKKRLEKKGKQAGELDQDEIMEALSQIDVSDEEMENLINYFKEKNINVITNDADDLDSLDDIEVDENSTDDDLLLDDEDFFDKMDDKEFEEIETLTNEYKIDIDKLAFEINCFIYGDDIIPFADIEAIRKTKILAKAIIY